jgi:hypothetical protein
MVLANARKYSSSSTTNTVVSQPLTAVICQDRFPETCVVMTQGIGEVPRNIKISRSNFFFPTPISFNMRQNAA